jgi:hypothetical protein
MSLVDSSYILIFRSATFSLCSLVHLRIERDKLLGQEEIAAEPKKRKFDKRKRGERKENKQKEEKESSDEDEDEGEGEVRSKEKKRSKKSKD